eukprot:scaffold8982_cov65-Phaeocystis_antarctica.AAC.5
MISLAGDLEDAGKTRGCLVASHSTQLQLTQQRLRSVPLEIAVKLVVGNCGAAACALRASRTRTGASQAGHAASHLHARRTREV